MLSLCKMIGGAVVTAFLLACAAMAQTKQGKSNPTPTAESNITVSRPSKQMRGSTWTKQSTITIQPNVGDLSRATECFWCEGYGALFAPNGKLLAVNERILVKLWDISTGRPLRTLDHSAYFLDFSFTPKGDRILTLHTDGIIRTWDTLSGMLLDSSKLLQLSDDNNRVLSGKLWHAPGRNVVVVTSDVGLVVVWDYVRRQRLMEVRVADRMNGKVDIARLSIDGTRLIAAGEGVVKFIDLKTKRTMRTIKIREDEHITVVGILDDRNVLIKSSWNGCDGELRLVDISNSEPRYESIDATDSCSALSDGRLDWENSTGQVNAFYRESERRLYIARTGAPGLRVWDMAGQRQVTTIPWLTEESGRLIAIDASYSIAAVAGRNRVSIVRLADGGVVTAMRTFGRRDVLAVMSYDERELLMRASDDEKQNIAIWPLERVAPRFHSFNLPSEYKIWHASIEAGLVLATNEKDEWIVYSMNTGEETAHFSIVAGKYVFRSRLSPDGSKALVGAVLENDLGTVTYLIDVKSNTELLAIEPGIARGEDGKEYQDYVSSFAFSPDGKRFVVGLRSGAGEVWSVDTRRLVTRLHKADDQTTQMYFSPDGQYVIGGSWGFEIFVWRVDSGKLVRVFRFPPTSHHPRSGAFAVSHESELIAAGTAQSSGSSGDAGRERSVYVWELGTGKLRFVLRGHESFVTALAFTRDNRWIVSGSYDGTIRYWDRKTGSLAATFATSVDDQWVMLTDKGFFAASANAGNLLSVVRGLQAVSIDQIWQSLYAPDLVREFLVGDPNREVESSAASANLVKVIDSGPAPTVAITSPTPDGRSATDLVSVSARVTDRGKGIGRVEWRVNGITAAVTAKPAGAGPDYTTTQELALDPGDNVIELVAYNGSNLLASVPARTTIKLDAAAFAVKPKLHILAIGINGYTDRGWTPRGQSSATRFPPLALAVKDSTAFASDMRQAAAGLYEEVRITYAHDTDSTRAGLEKVIDKLAGEIHPRDTFILFAAAHGKSENGRFYLIPQDFQSGPDALARTAIGQDMIQDWLANRIKAKKAVILLDTCESGALIAGHARARTEVAASDAAVGRLHEATGRPVLTAAASGKPAWEGYKGHGVFTWALIDALRNGDANGNGTIELSELVAHVQDRVPKISAELQGVGRAAIAIADIGVATRAAGAGSTTQSARFGSRGEDFVLARRLQ